MGEEISKKRNINIDIIKTIAILLVILCHCTEHIYNMKRGSFSVQSTIFAISTFTIGRIGVPLFLFVSGVLLLNKTIEDDSDVFSFYKRNLLPLFIANERWVIIYNCFLCLINNNYLISLGNVVKQLLLMEYVPLSNMWYMPMILGLYLCIPFVAKIVKQFSYKTFLILLAFIFIVNFWFPTINILFNIYSIDNVYKSFLDLNFLGGVFWFYVIVGYYIFYEKIKNVIKCYIYTRNSWIYLCSITAIFYIFITF